MRVILWQIAGSLFPLLLTANSHHDAVHSHSLTTAQSLVVYSKLPRSFAPYLWSRASS